MDNNISTKKPQSGFSLVELSVTIAIMLMLFIMSENFIRTGFKSARFGDEQGEAVGQARRALQFVSLDVREAAQSERGDYPLALIDSKNFIWYGDINNDGQAEKIRYFLDGLDLLRVVTLPGASNNYDIAGGTTSIATYINNQAADPVFRYFNATLLETANINEVRLVRINLKVNVTPTVMPNDYELETDINLRNLKDNL